MIIYIPWKHFYVYLRESRLTFGSLHNYKEYTNLKQKRSNCLATCQTSTTRYLKGMLSFGTRHKNELI